MSKKKTKKKEFWGGYKQFTLTDGTKFLARDEHDAELYRSKEEILLARNAEKKAALKKAVQKQKDFINHKIGK